MANVLIVEDDKLLATTLANMLKHEGICATEARNLSAATDFLNSDEEIDLILLDIWLEGRVSFPLIDLAKEKRSSVPLLVMSGGGGALSLEVASSIAEMKGISGFIQKPIEMSSLIETVGQFL